MGSAVLAVWWREGERLGSWGEKKEGRKEGRDGKTRVHFTLRGDTLRVDTPYRV